MGRPGKMIPPGYYRALDDDGEYHLYPVEDEEAEDRRYLNERTGIALQVATLCMRVMGSIQAGEGVCSWVLLTLRIYKYVILLWAI